MPNDHARYSIQQVQILANVGNSTRVCCRRTQKTIFIRVKTQGLAMFETYRNKEGIINLIGKNWTDDQKKRAHEESKKIEHYRPAVDDDAIMMSIYLVLQDSDLTI